MVVSYGLLKLSEYLRAVVRVLLLYTNATGQKIKFKHESKQKYILVIGRSMITAGLKRMTLVLGTVLARGPQRLCVHYDNPGLRTSPR